MPHATKIALILALAIHLALVWMAKIAPSASPVKAPETYVEVALYDPPPASIPEPAETPAPAEPEPPPPEPAPPPPPTEPIPAPLETVPEPTSVEPKPEPKVPKPVMTIPKPVAQTPPRPTPAKPTPAATPPITSQKSSPQTSGGNSTYQAVNSVTFLNRRTPSYPPDALRNKQTGRVVLLLYINEFGTVDQVETVTSSSIASLDAAATAAAKKSTFRPAMSGGRPVKSKAKVPFNFRISR